MQDSTTLTFEPPLFPNLYLADRPYAMGKPREEGESDLVLLAQSDVKEEGAWAFAEDAQVWRNIRKQASSSVRGQSLETKADTLFFDMAQLGKRVSLYHIHPQYCIDYQAELLWKQMLSEGAGEMPQEKQDELKGTCRSVGVVSAILPSYLDVGAAVRHLEVSGECDIDFKIVSPLYITTFTLDRTHPDFGSVMERYTALSGRMLELIAKEGGRIVDAVNEAMAGSLTISVEYTGELIQE